MNKYKITVVGLGYVGMSMACLLSQNNKVIALDLDQDKVDKVNKRISPIRDEEIDRFFKEKNLDLRATSDSNEALKDADYVVLATPTDYDVDRDYFDTSSLDGLVKKTLEINTEASIVIKSTIPIGYVNQLREKLSSDRIFFSPEFLREGQALYDNLYPSRIIVGEKTQEAKTFAQLLLEGAKKKDVPVLFVGTREAESIKLFSNSYLAMRVAFFNEVDSFAEVKGLASQEIIEGMGLDDRIGSHYNNPSFGYGGYCLPKDTRQLLANFKGVPQEMITALVEANATRKRHVADQILSRKPQTVGIYKLAMKAGSDNFRSAAILDVINHIREEGVDLIIYEPSYDKDTLDGIKIEKSLEDFKEKSDVIVTNRLESDLEDVLDKVYSRDIFREN